MTPVRGLRRTQEEEAQEEEAQEAEAQEALKAEANGGPRHASECPPENRSRRFLLLDVREPSRGLRRGCWRTAPAIG